jgi:hypothetical protein
VLSGGRLNIACYFRINCVTRVGAVRDRQPTRIAGEEINRALNQIDQVKRQDSAILRCGAKVNGESGQPAARHTRSRAAPIYSAVPV